MINRILKRLEEESFWAESTFDEDGYLCDDGIQVVNLQTAKEIVQEVAKEYGYTRTLNRCDSCIHYIADKVPPICYFCSKGMEDNYKAREGE